MKCLQCSNLDLQTFPAHSKTGYGRCKVDLPGVFVSLKLEQNCNKFKQAEESIVTARIGWASKLNKGGNSVD